jgi:hypothetical protein
VRLPQRMVGAAQFADRAAGEHHANQLAGSRKTRRAVQGDRQRAAISPHDAQLAVLNRCRARSRKEIAGALPRRLVGKKLAHRPATQFAFVLADEAAQRVVDLVDRAMAITDDQDVRHRRQHALDELLRVLECGVLLLEHHLVLQKVVVHLVHLVDHLDPHRLVDAANADPPAAGRQPGALRAPGERSLVRDAGTVGGE